MAFISRQGIESTFSADAHLLSPNNRWAMDVFFIYFFLDYNNMIHLFTEFVKDFYKTLAVSCI